MGVKPEMEMMSVPEVAAQWHMSEKFVIDHCCKEPGAQKMGRVWRIPVSVVNRVFRGFTPRPPEPRYYLEAKRGPDGQMTTTLKAQPPRKRRARPGPTGEPPIEQTALPDQGATNYKSQ